jgi:hypothetical protein
VQPTNMVESNVALSDFAILILGEPCYANQTVQTPLDS